MTAADYAFIAMEDSSTGALTFVFVPVYQLAIVGVVGLVASTRRSKKAR